MGENAKLVGEKLEGFSSTLFEKIGWNEIVRDLEIKCKKSAHKNENGNSKTTHGVDLLHTVNDPYLDKNIGIVTECKNRQWKGINKSKVELWFNELLNTIECLKNSNEINTYDLEGANICMGLLLINCNDENFNDEEFRKYINNIYLPKKRDPINIYIAGNNEIEKWYALFNKIESFKKNGSEIKIIYPSLDNSKRAVCDYVTPNHLFSRYVFAVNSYYQEVENHEQGRPDFLARKKNIIFSFDNHSTDSFLYLCSMFKYFQFEDANEFVFCFYPHHKEDIDFISNNFIKTIKKQSGSSILDENKIRIEFMRNKKINVVDYGSKGCD